MTTYRVYYPENGPGDWVKYVEAESEQHAKSQVEDDPNEWPYLAALPLPEEMQSPCVCSETPVLFKQVDADDPGFSDPEPSPKAWQCQACQRTFICPPDEINWEDEKMFDAGYEVCGCDHYDVSCRCQGAGWWRPGDDEDEEDGGYDDEDDGGYDDDPTFCDPYYEEDDYYEMQ